MYCLPMCFSTVKTSLVCRMSSLRMGLLVVVSVYAQIIHSCWGTNHYRCKSVQYVSIFQMETIQCSFENFYAVAWYNADEVASRRSFIHLINGKKEGEGYTSGEFDIHLNGSLVFKNVTLQHDRNYTVFILESQHGNPVSLDVQVVVTVKPSTAFPVIDACEKKCTTCFKRLSLNSEITCEVTGARPFIPLSWAARHFGRDSNISFQVSVTEDSALSTSRATTMDGFSNSSLLRVLVCKADNHPKILLKDEAVILVENSDYDLAFVNTLRQYVEMNSRLELRCSDANISEIVWKRLEEDTQNPIVISYGALYEENTSRTYFDDYELQKDGSLVVSRFEAKHEGLFECVFEGNSVGNATRFEVLTYVTANPFVHGCPQDQYCVLLKQSEGTLTCSVKGIRPQVNLEWKTIHEKDSTLISFIEKQTTSNKIGDVFDVQITAKYKIERKDIDRLSLECVVLEPEIPSLVLTTKFDLLINIGPPGIKPTDAIKNTKTSLLWILVILIIPAVLTVIWMCRYFIGKDRCITKDKTLATEEDKENIPMLSTAFEEADPLTAKKEIFVSELKEKYRDLYEAVQPIPYIRERLYCVDGVFVEGGIEYLATSGRLGGPGVWNKLSTHHDILKDPRLKSRRRILEGEPGYGKSTMTLQLAYEWCNKAKASYLKKTDILILLKLRQLKGISSIYEAISLFLLPKDSKLTTSDITQIMGGMFSVVVLLDGFDEYPDRDSNQKSDILKIIEREMFQQYEVVVTTRVSCLPKKYPPSTKRIKLAGFDEHARDQYIRKAVVGDDSEATLKIKQHLKENPILGDLCQVPLFFVLFAHMSHESEDFKNINSVTSFFQYMVGCLANHLQNKMRDDNVATYEVKTLNHDELDRLAFEGLTADSQEIVWRKADISNRVGEDLYEQYVRLGILIEEQVLDVSEQIEYKTEVHFCHKIFCEWYAAHFVSDWAAKSNVTLQTSLKSDGTVHDQGLTDRKEGNILDRLDPFELQYVYRFACGLNPAAAEKLICYLRNRGDADKFIILCIVEKSRDVQNALKDVEDLCSRDVYIDGNDSLLLQKSTIQLLQMASMSEISISRLWLGDCYLSVDTRNGNIQLTSNNCIPALKTLKELVIEERGRTMTVEEFLDILKNTKFGPKLKDLRFYDCLLPQSIEKALLKDLMSRDVQGKAISF